MEDLPMSDEIRTALPTFALALYPNIRNLTFTGTGAFVGTGNSLDNVIAGGPGNDILIGYAGNDTFIGNAGVDVLDGGTGTDIADYSTSNAAINVDLTARIASGGDAQGDVLLSIEGVTGSNYADTLSSATSGHILRGGGGNDIYNTGAYFVSIIEAKQSGIDEIQTTTQYIFLTNHPNVENITYIGNETREFLGYGNELNNKIIAKDGNDHLNGYGGNDTLIGGGGHDTISGGPGADIVDGGAGYDRAIFSETARVTIDLHSGLLSSGEAKGDIYTGIELFVTGGGDDVFYADDSPTAFWASLGYDSISYMYSTSPVTITINANTFFPSGSGKGGFAEGDYFSDIEIYYGSNHDDTYIINGPYTTYRIIERESGGIDEIRIDAPRKILDSFFENLTYTGSGNFEGYGNQQANIIIGGAGDDILGGGGAADELIGGAGADTFSFAVLDGTSDIIRDFDAGADRIEIFRGAFTAFAQAPAGTLPTGTFEVGPVATKATSRLVYDDATGSLYYDSDGYGGAAQTRIASLPNVPQLSVENFVLI